MPPQAVLGDIGLPSMDAVDINGHFLTSQAKPRIAGYGLTKQPGLLGRAVCRIGLTGADA